MIEAIAAISHLGASGQVVEQSSVSTQESFKSVLSEKMQLADESINLAESQLKSAVDGQNVSIHEAMIAMEKARMQLSLVVEVRNKLVEAYQEVTRMQI